LALSLNRKTVSVIALKEKRFIVIQGNLAAWIALYFSQQDPRELFLDA
jgi:hypothetical protein